MQDDTLLIISASRKLNTQKVVAHTCSSDYIRARSTGQIYIGKNFLFNENDRYLDEGENSGDLERSPPSILPPFSNLTGVL